MIYKPIKYFTIVFIFYLVFFTQAFSKDDPSKYILETDDWYYDVDEENGYVWMLRNGKVTHGDKIRFLLDTHNCDIVRELFSFYTMMDNPNIDSLEKRVLGININGNDVGAEIQFVMPFLSGHSVLFDMGRYWVDEHIEFHKSKKVYKVELFDQKDFLADEYFDVKFNEWDMDNFAEYLKAGQMKCKLLPKQLQS